MDILTAIEKDHAEFRRQLETLEQTATTARERSLKTFRELHDHLVAHHEAEEHVLFRPLDKIGAAQDPVEEAWEEHTAIDLYLEDIKKSRKTERWEAKISVLKEMVEHHLDEEESKVFQAARANLGPRLAEMGERFEAQEQKHLEG